MTDKALVRHQTEPTMEVISIEQPPGLYPGINAFEYHRWAGASQSRLKVIRDQSPAHLRWQMDNPRPSTPAQEIGAAVHTAVLEPDLFTGLYVQGIEGDGRTKPVKEARAQLEADHPNSTVLTAKDYVTCLAVRDSVAAHPHAKALLGGEHETSAVWQDEDTGVLCRGRFDARGMGAITDVKTTRDASPDRFPYDFAKYGYHIQGNHYLRGDNTLGGDANTFVIVAVEKEPPYCVAVYQVDAKALYDGRRELDILLQRWAECAASGIWPGYSTDVVTIDLPAYEVKKTDARVERWENE